MYKNSNGIYYAEFVLQGKRYRKSLKTKDKKVAQKLEVAYKKEVEEDLLLPEWLKVEPGNLDITIKELFDFTFEKKWNLNKRPDNNENLVNMIYSLIGADTKLKNLNIETLKKKLRDRGISNSTMNRYRAALVTAISLNIKYKKIPSAYSIDWDKYREPKTRIRFITHQQEQEAMALADPDMRDLIAILVDTGARLSEILKLPIEDIDFNRGIIQIWVNKADHPRAIPMTERVRNILEKRSKTWGTFKGTLYTFSKDVAVMRMGRISKQMGPRGFTLHELRHTTGSRLAHKGVDAFTIQSVLGHKNVATTQRYVHMSGERLKEAIRLLED
jgi:integrase